MRRAFCRLFLRGGERAGQPSERGERARRRGGRKGRGEAELEKNARGARGVRTEGNPSAGAVAGRVAECGMASESPCGSRGRAFSVLQAQDRRNLPGKGGGQRPPSALHAPSAGAASSEPAAEGTEGASFLRSAAMLPPPENGPFRAGGGREGRSWQGKKNQL